MQFSVHFSYMLLHIELKFCIWLCFTLLQIKFGCRKFASIFVGVTPLLELRILEIHSFPHFSLTSFDILNWNFSYDFVLLYYSSSLSIINLRQFLWELCPFWNLEYWKYTFFRTFLLHALIYWAEILHVTLLGPRLTRRVPYSNHSVLLSVRPSVLLSVCPSKNFNIGHNFFTFKDKSFIFGMCDPYDKTFPMVPWILNLWPWPWPLTYFWKTLTLAITSLLKEIGLSYLACVYLMTRPFRRNHKFRTCDLDRDLWPTFEKL